MDPLVGFYYYAPVYAAMNLLVAPATELPRFDPADLARVGLGPLLANALVAFLLNVASVFLIGKTSGLAMTLAGIFKNILLILLILLSVLLWRTQITLLQAVGYAISLAGPPSSLFPRTGRVLLAIFVLSSLLLVILMMNRYDARLVYEPATAIGTE